MTDPIMGKFMEFNPNPSEWNKYRCRSCRHADWVEDIIVDAFPPVEPEGFPAIECPECGDNFRCNTSEEVNALVGTRITPRNLIFQHVNPTLCTLSTSKNIKNKFLCY
jgi:predicted RNA-binding Zn-ribbon protein involved in translation (DUF1610 family)